MSEQKQPSFNAVALQASTDMLAGIVVGSFLGWAIDRWLDSFYWGVIIGFILGSISGLWTVYRRLCKMGYGLGQQDK